MSEEQKDTIFRFAIIFIALLIGFICVVVKIVRIQRFDSDRWLAIAEKQKPVDFTIRATRGNILDCNGNLLASSMPRYDVFMDASVPALHQKNGELFHESIDSLSILLSEVIAEYSAAEYKQSITKAYHKGTTRLKISDKRINYMQRRKLEKAYPINKGKYKSGVFFEPKHRRIKPFGNLASRTIGSTDQNKDVGITGLEKAFEEQLRGIDGIAALQRIGGRMEKVTIEEAQDGMDILTTIDTDLQDIVEKTLRQRLLSTEAQWGCCVLMETKSGEIKAISNLDKNSDGTYSERQNHAVTRIEPGSTFKTIALIAAIDDGKISINDTVSVSSKGWKYFDAIHTDAHAADTVYTVHDALAVSSNIAMAKLITRAYEGSAKKFVNRIAKTGIMDSVYCEIPGAQQALIIVPKDTVTLSKMSYGYSVEMTPMQIMMFYNAIANDGKMIRPVLVKEIQQNGETVHRYTTETVKSSICRSSTLSDIKSALHDVVWNDQLGTASVNKKKEIKAKSDKVHIAGKTGTAQLLLNGRYNKNRHRLTFVGYFPEEDPQYTCICVIDDPIYGGHDAGTHCGIVVRLIAEKVMANTGCYVFDKEGNKTLVRNEK